MNIAEKLSAYNDVRLYQEAKDLMLAAAEEIGALNIQLTAARLSVRFYKDHAMDCSEKMSEWMSKFLNARRENQELINLLKDMVNVLSCNDEARLNSDFSHYFAYRIDENCMVPELFPEHLKKTIKRVHAVVSENYPGFFGNNE